MTIVVTLGKPSQTTVKLSKSQLIPAGTVVFKVTNSGTIGGSFKVCLTPVSTAANACKGKALTTSLLKPGQSQLLTVALAKKGTYQFIGALTGKAASPITGLFGIGVKVTSTSSDPCPDCAGNSDVSGFGTGSYVPIPTNPDDLKDYWCDQLRNCGEGV